MTQAAKAQVDDLIETSARLIELMEQETLLLKAMKASEIGKGQAEKDRLARSFEAKLRQLAGDAPAMAALAPALRQELGGAMGRFRATMRANELALRAAREANERVVRAILDAAQSQAAPAHAYSASGKLGAATAGDRQAPAPVALDRRL
ncbi:MAG: hypothetical protein L6R19_24000 [Alphaproteobacteria bacterium]|nr:hypothetical protein [Alphaproteobacteria bacterium]